MVSKKNNFWDEAILQKWESGVANDAFKISLDFAEDPTLKWFYRKSAVFDNWIKKSRNSWLNALSRYYS